LNTGLDFEPKRILVFRYGHLGDILVALPAIWTIKKAFPNAHLTLLSSFSYENTNYPTATNVLPREGLFDDWLVFPTQAGKAESLYRFAKLFLQIRRRKIDTLFYLMTRNRQPGRIKRDMSFFRYAGVRQQIGTKHLLENVLPEAEKAPLPALLPEHQYLLSCLTEEGIGSSYSDGFDPTDLLLSDQEKSFAENWLRENCQDALTGKRLIAVAPGSKWDSKIWDEGKYIKVLSRLITSKNLFPVMFGGMEDSDKGERIVRALGAGANAAGKFSVRESAAALAHCRLYLGNDTGTMHLAASVGVPCAAIFAAIDYPGRWSPYGQHNIVIRKRVPCEGCHSPYCKFNRECLETSVDEVYEACLKILEKNG
jgi:ADP-heptose:LPS heptosyltransferase